MLEYYALWFISFLLLVAEIIVGLLMQSKIVAIIIGFCGYIVGVIALSNEKEFHFSEHRRFLFAPAAGIISSLFLFCSLFESKKTYFATNEEPVSPYFAIGLILFLIVTVIVTIAAFNCTKWISRRFPKRQITYTPPEPEQLPLPEGGWRCKCGRPHAPYVSDCVCGCTKKEAQNHTD